MKFQLLTAIPAILRICSVTICSVTFLRAEPLKLVDYLQQVKLANDGLKAIDLRTEGYRKEASERGMLLSPHLIGQAHFVSDSKETNSPSALGTKTLATSYSLGLSQLTTFGLKGQVSYQIAKTDIEGTLLAEPKFWTAAPMIEISQPLWRNFFGSETRAQLKAVESKALGSSFQESFKSKQLLAAAELAYWNARLSQKTIQLRKETLERASQIKEWTDRRVSLQLADKSDLLQATSALKARNLELQRAEDDAKETIHTFNAYRGVDSNEISDEFEEAAAVDLPLPDRAPLRDDTRAAEQLSFANKAVAQMNLEKGMPSLEASAALAFNGRDPQFDQGLRNSAKSNHATYSIGVVLNAPLGWSSASKLREGALQEREAAELDYKRKLFDQEKDWKSFERKFQAAKDRLKLIRSLEDSEKEKVLHERERLRKGRTTTFQVLLFEQDYANSKLNRLLTEIEVLSLHAQLKTFQ